MPLLRYRYEAKMPPPGTSMRQFRGSGESYCRTPLASKSPKVLGTRELCELHQTGRYGDGMFCLPNVPFGCRMAVEKSGCSAQRMDGMPVIVL